MSQDKATWIQIEIQQHRIVEAAIVAARETKWTHAGKFARQREEHILPLQEAVLEYLHMIGRTANATVQNSGHIVFHDSKAYNE